MTSTAETIAIAALHAILASEQCNAAAKEIASTAIAELAPPAPPATQPRATYPADASFIVYSDGACKGNPGPAGWGAVLTHAGAIVGKKNGYLGHKTNQIAELVAATEALLLTPSGATVTLVTDSQYTRKGLLEWRAGWERRGWRNAQNEPVANKDYWQALFAAADARHVSVEWVKGHSGDPLNEMCDQLAGAAIKAGLQAALPR